MSSWDMITRNDRAPEPRRSRGEPTRAQTEPAKPDGLLDFGALLRFLAQNIISVVLVATVLAGLFFAAAFLFPFPYVASAIVFVDPRDEKVTLQEAVLPAIGTDAAVLESMVQIVKSDGFLIEIMEKLKLLEGGAKWENTDEQLKQLSKLRKKIDIERMGATYLIKISFHGVSAESSARIANEIAAAFAASQNGLRADATINASRSLSDRLVEIRAKLNSSEEAVARFKDENNIVYIDQLNTVQMRQLADLSMQLAAIRGATKEANARYAENLQNGTITRSTAQGNDENEQLSFLRKQRTQLAQIRDQQSQIYGPNHPKLVETNQALAGLDRQIREQRTLVVGQLKSEKAVSQDKERQLVKQMDELSAQISKTEVQRVKLTALEREAAANRDLYQQLLSRTKATNELSKQPTDNVRVVSPALPPLMSTRPPLVLLVPVICFFSFALSMVLVTLAKLGRWRKMQPVEAEIRPFRTESRVAGPQTAAQWASVRRSGPVLSYRPDEKKRHRSGSRW